MNRLPIDLQNIVYKNIHNLILHDVLHEMIFDMVKREERKFKMLKDNIINMVNGLPYIKLHPKIPEEYGILKLENWLRNIKYRNEHMRSSYLDEAGF